MQSLPALCLVLCAIAVYANAAHHYLRHRSPSGHISSVLGSTGGPSASGSEISASAPFHAPYPVGNGTFGGPTGTINAISGTTMTSANYDTLYASSTESSEAPSFPAYVSGLGGMTLPASPASGSGSSAILHGPDNIESSCEAPVTVTITQGTTITSIVAASSSQISLESRSAAPIQATYQSIPSVITSSALPTTAIAGGTLNAKESKRNPVSVAEKVADHSVASMKVSSSTKSAAVAEQSSPNLAVSTSSGAPLEPSSESSNLTPNGIKAGIAGYRSITDKSSWSQFTPHIGWYTDYWPDTPDSGPVTGIGMLWGDGHQSGDDASRLSTFTSLPTPPKHMLGFYEPDFHAPDSSEISPTSAATSWSSLLAPLHQHGTLLGSPSLATQKDESWLTPFANAPEHPTWDFTCIHTNKPNVTGVKEDVEYYLAKYKKPLWVSEFACVDDQTWTPCTDPEVIKRFIHDVVAFFQANESVVAYGYSNGNGLGDVWPMFDGSGAITTSGRVYLEAISAL